MKKQKNAGRRLGNPVRFKSVDNGQMAREKEKMQIQIGKFDPDTDTSGKQFYEVKKERKSWGFQMQIGGIVCPDWARPKAYFVGGNYGWGSAISTIKAAESLAKTRRVKAVFDLSSEAKKQLSELTEEVKLVEMGDEHE